jgi:hypothetical protein
MREIPRFFGIPIVMLLIECSRGSLLYGSEMKIERLHNNPIITAELDPEIGENINGPSLIRVPDWIENPLGKYYLYFGHHSGAYIRLAYADEIEGPWTVYSPGTLRLEDSYCLKHIASPDVHVDHDRKEIRMYYHGPVPADECPEESAERRFPVLGNQRTRVATSNDGIHFTARRVVVGASYFRRFRWDGMDYGIAMPGIFYRSKDGLSDFETGPILFDDRMRHAAVRVVDGTLYVFYTNVGDCPERILLSTIELTPDWMEWKASEPATVLEPETEYEGADRPLEPSVRGLARGRVHQLRDPAIFEEDGVVYLLYSVAGESGIAAARITGFPEAVAP